MTFVLVTLGWIFSLCLHEYAHARVAYAGGDLSVREKGYLTFNPFKYTHPLYSLGMPLLFLLLGGIGLPGGAVYIDHRRLRGPRWESAVAAAGPAANLALAIVLGLILRFTPSAGPTLRNALACLGLLQVTAVVLNLIPVPPLDGYGIIEPHMTPEVRRRAASVARWSIWVVFLALWYLPPVSRAFWQLVGLLTAAIGIPPHLALKGLDAFQFWVR
ncbi:MAG: site-2 protease family protein [Acidobacteria bacterium]|jgi:Zn-dependent protease|nr:site-2 protease family protein [Acidobacteriota bacterium]